MSKLSYREMNPSDAAAVLAVRLATRENVVTMEELAEVYGVTLDSISRAIAADVRGWLCEEDSNVVGFSMGDKSSGEVLVVAVLPDHERRGIGGRLLNLVQRWLFSEGWEEIWLKANPDPNVRATGFYEHFGWRAIGVMDGEDHVLKLRIPDGPQ